MSKRLKVFTKIISVILVVIMFTESCPMNAFAAFIADVQDNGTIVENYDESRNFYYDYHSIDVGRAGTLSINDYTLTPSLSFNALGIDGNVLPVSVSMKYNSPEYRFLKEIMGYTPTAYGNGWLTNYNSMLCELENENETQLAYVTGTGAVMVFAPAATDENLPEGTTKWTIPELEDVYILKVSDESANADANLAQYTLCTDGATRVFDKFGRLISLVNTSNSATNTIHYVYNDGTNLEDIAEIIDGVGNEYRFTYTDGQLTKIKCYNPDGNAIIVGDGENSAPLEMNFAYTGGNLTTVTFPDGKTINYAYNSADVMFRAVNIDGYKAEITFSDGYATKLAEFSPNGTEGGYVNIARNENTRTFTDDKGEVQVKTFDENGKILTIVDGEGNYLYGAPEQEEEDSTATEEDVSVFIPEEDASEIYTSVCHCADCTEWDCACECESEEVCDCVQCKRYSDTVEDENGNVLSEESFDGTKTMKAQNFYTSDGNRLASSVDTSGNAVYYIYDETGFMQSMTSGDMEVLFDYDAMGNLTRLYQQVSGLSNGTTMSNQYTYTNDKVSSITHNGFTYNFTYDEWGNQTSVQIAGVTLIGYEYADREGTQISEITYATGKSVSYSYNDDGNITGVSYNGGETTVYEFSYDETGNLTAVTDNITGLITTYSDTDTEIRRLDNNELLYSFTANEDGTETENILGTSITYTYNSEYNNVTGKTVSTKSFEHTIIAEETSQTLEQNIDMAVTSDWFGRTDSKEITVDSLSTNTETEETSEFHVEAEYNYAYDDTDTTASTKITSHSSAFISEDYTNSRTDYYEYDATGNITGIYRYVDGVKTYYYNYVYDEAGQLVRENLLEDNKTIIYLYDVGGNIVSKTEYAYTMDEITAEDDPIEVSTYSYNNPYMKDLLTHYTSTDGNIDTDILYDKIGNITYFNGQTYTWNANKQLETVLTADNDLIRYYYNENGFLSRLDMYDDNGTVCSGSLSYIWNGDVLVSRYVTDYESDEITYSNIIYDTEGDAVGTVISQTTDGVTTETFFLYRKNLQGDITGVIDSVTGKLMASYTYDVYGNVGLQPINDNNLSLLGSAFMYIFLPQSYRGYTYSILGEELCYYLGSRFYSPRLGRFLNADKHFDTGTGVLGTNVYAYCNNNPVMYVDPNGESAQGNTSLNMTQVLSYVSKMTKIVTKFKAVLRSLSDRIRYFKYVNIAMNLIKEINPIKGYNGPYIEVNSQTQTINVLYESRFRSLGKPFYIEMTFFYGTLNYWQKEISEYLYSQIGPFANINGFFDNNEVLGHAFSELVYSYSTFAGVVWDAFDILCQIIENSNSIHNCIITRVEEESQDGREFTGNEIVVVFYAIYHIEWRFSKGQYVVTSTKKICVCNDF